MREAIPHQGADLMALASLIHWLGPWADASAAPPEPVRSEIMIEGPRLFAAWVYRPRRPRSACLLLQGLHYAGPADPRFDRFARILAASGLLVMAPFLPDYCALRLRP